MDNVFDYLRTFKESVSCAFNKYGPFKQKCVHTDKSPFMTKVLRKAIRKRSILRNNRIELRQTKRISNFKGIFVESF